MALLSLFIYLLMLSADEKLFAFILLKLSKN